MHFASGQMCFMADRHLICIEVAYGTSVDQSLIELKVPSGTTLIEAIRLSGITEYYPEIDLNKSRKGIFSQIAEDETVLQEHDRVEIYRPLIVDPKEARRQRALKGIKHKNKD